MASYKYYNYYSDPVVKNTNTTAIIQHLGYSYIDYIGRIYSYSDQSTKTTANCWTGWCYNYSFSGTWPSSVTLTLSGQAVSFFSTPPTNPYCLISTCLIGLFKSTEKWDTTFTTDFTSNLTVYKMQSNASTTSSDDFGNWWILTPIKGNVTRTFSLDTSVTSEKEPSMKLSIRGNIWSSRNSTAGSDITTTDDADDDNVEITFSYPKPTMTLSLASVTKELAVINITNHTNPLSYWRYKAQWKLSTASSWSTSSTAFTVTSSTGSRQLTTTSLTPGATYNYRIAYIDQNDNIVGNSSSISFTIPADQATVQYNSSGTVKKAKVWYNDGGTIKKVKNIYYNNGGTIKNVKKV